MDSLLQSEVLDRLDQDHSVKSRVADLVLAAMLGEVESCLEGKTPERPKAEARHAVEPVRAFVESIAVEGFRGIGPRVKLNLRAGPGLTLVIGRNGSGKSSFSEALELLLTGDNQRWSSRRTKVWREGWRNLHQPQSTRIEARLLIDGRAGAYTVTRAWSGVDDLDDGEAAVQRDGASAPLTSLGWEEALSTYRPFLSYNELGSMLEEGPAKLFDALAAILGLEDLIAAADDLREIRTTRTKVHKTVSDQLETIRKSLATHPDPRAAQCLNALALKPWDLDRVAALVTGSSTAKEDGETRRLRELASLKSPEPASIESAVNALRAATAALEAVAGTDAGKARRRAEILERAMELHRLEGDRDCPVCGQTAALHDQWHRDAGEEIKKLRGESEAADAAHRNRANAEREARQMMAGPPASVSDPALLALWNTWSAGVTKAGHELASPLEMQAPPLHTAILETRLKAQTDLQKREDQWRPVAETFAAWLPGARKMAAEAPAVSSLKAAEDWLRTTATQIHNERFEPIKERVMKIWSLLRTQSHVKLEDVSFQGKSTARRVNLDVSVDGTRGAALGVMSQGELHSLALSLFVPRATLETSPFRFLMIDDPVQSMDPVRIDGLARVLELVSKKRQVVVFTHDDRLPEAIRRFNIEAQTVEVSRSDGSVVE
ncbi:MAG TPA: AAA family ATPase, partial [Terriglobia bacterium]|nr:AAA family ATPase [Terriglobia bacterium]